MKPVCVSVYLSVQMCSHATTRKIHFIKHYQKNSGQGDHFPVFSVPVSLLFVHGRILALHTKRTIGRKGLQVELRHVWHREVDWTVVSERSERNAVNINTSQRQEMSFFNLLSFTCWSPQP